MKPAMALVEKICAREVLDSRGNPTVEVEVRCRGGASGCAIVPSGASTGRFEAHELRDGDPARYEGRGVRRAVANVTQVLASELVGLAVEDQAALDARLLEIDGTANKSRLGANALLGVSLACAHAAASVKGIPTYRHLHDLWRNTQGAAGSISNRITAGTSPARGSSHRLRLPLPMVNMISGGLHAGRNVDFQDFLIVPVGATEYSQALEWVVRVYNSLRRTLAQRGLESALVGDEGGFGPRLQNNSQAVGLVLEAVQAAGLAPGSDVALALDVASSHFYDGASYHLAATGDQRLSAAEMVELLEHWVEQYPIVSIEDALAEDDWEGWELLTARLGHRVQLVGDDLFVTQLERLSEGIRRGVANSVLIKVNQVGTLSEALATVRASEDAGYRPVISARSGETEDCTLADLAVATGAGQIKIGSVARSERLAKYNRLLRIEEELGAEGEYLGGAIFGAGGL